MLAPDAWVPLAEVARPHGVRGELRLRPYNQDSDVLLDLDEVAVRIPAGPAGPARDRCCASSPCARPTTRFS